MDVNVERAVRTCLIESGSVQSAWDHEAIEREVQRVMDRTQEVGARVLVPGSSDWPTQLQDLGERAPAALWVRGGGDLRVLAAQSVAIVGTRAATSYGSRVTTDWSARLATEGWAVLSGGAYGIDAAAHRGALRVGGSTIAVLASGVDVPTPHGHEDLFEEMLERGCLVSERPPGMRPDRWSFLVRNRLIAALARATIIVEAPMKSGARATVAEAQKLFRLVMAVPGPVTSINSRASHGYIADGSAALVGRVEEVLELLGPTVCLS